jgi:glucokinase
MSDIFVADIGGTTTRMATAATGCRPANIVTISNDTVSGLEQAMERFLDEAGARPRAAVLGVAGPVDGDEIALTNRDWRFRLADLSARFGISPIRAVNDFEAVASGLPSLALEDLHPLGPRLPIREGVKVVLGPGTGLGVAALVPVAGAWHAVASEGGHISFGPNARDEEPVFTRLQEQTGPVMAETVLCGPGLARLHQAVNPGTMRLAPEMILRQARAGNREARATVSLFVRLLGRFAGDAALLFKATGGVYVVGGVALGLGPLFDAALFRTAFEMHPPYQQFLADIPATLITCEEPGLIGCAAIGQRLLQDLGR